MALRLLYTGYLQRSQTSDSLLPPVRSGMDLQRMIPYVHQAGDTRQENE